MPTGFAWETECRTISRSALRSNAKRGPIAASQASFAMSHPCLSCGACCATYRVSMHWSEADAALGGRVPVELTESLGPHQRCMRGTWEKTPRCVALEGPIGGPVRCTIYEDRPSVCRELSMSWEHGEPSPQCDKARALHGLAPLTRAEVEAALG